MSTNSQDLVAALARRFVLVRGDLTRERADALVNAANAALAGGGGVDGALHRAAGPELQAECAARHPRGCPTGDVRVTAAYRLSARYVFHAVGPVWEGGGAGEPELLAACYRRSIELAEALGVRTLAFPAISCGVYGYPWPAAAEVACTAIVRALEAAPAVVEVRVVLASDALLEHFAAARARLLAEWREPRA
ncbi:MAG: macro domain-containing protein [Planctomycetes bacterium]|nr:macro domain-containing protein [Planctomycetota bacterium]